MSINEINQERYDLTGIRLVRNTEKILPEHLGTPSEPRIRGFYGVNARLADHARKQGAYVITSDVPLPPSDEWPTYRLDRPHWTMEAYRQQEKVKNVSVTPERVAAFIGKTCGPHIDLCTGVDFLPGSEVLDINPGPGHAVYKKCWLDDTIPDEEAAYHQRRKALKDIAIFGRKSSASARL